MISFSVLIITHGREELLMKCLDSLRPLAGDWQLVLVGNGRELSTRLIERAHELTSDLKLITTPEKLMPGKARNLGLEHVNKDWIFFLDDDAHLLPGYFEVALPLLKMEDLDVFGGPDTPAEGMTAFSQSLALALSSPFCTGLTAARHRGLGKGKVWADEEKLTSCNLWVRRSILENVRFPEDYLRAEETLFLQRLSAKGAKMIYHPRLAVAHFRRKNLKELLRPSFFAGFFRSRVLREKLASGQEVFWLPAIFVLLHFFLFFDPPLFWTMVRIYAGVVGAVSLGLSVKARNIFLWPLVIFLHYFIVFLYGVGFLAERVRNLWK